jgi:hypothetical protein
MEYQLRDELGQPEVQMKILRSCLIVACVLACAVQATAGQQPAAQRGAPPPQGAGMGAPQRQAARPPRDTREQRPGTGVVRGRVLSADSGSPVRRAQVRLASAELRENRMTSTDEDGRYEFRTLSAGRYTLNVSKSGYVTLQYGQRRPLEPGKPLDVAEGQTVDKADFSLPRGSVIVGRVTDEYGEPISDAVLQAMRYQYNSGQRRLMSTGRQAVSDDIGQFRIFGLPPGTYVVSATIRTGGMFANSDDNTSGYAPTYYPGTASVAEAQRLSLALGQELAGVAFSLIPARMSRITGTVVNSQGQPLGGGMVVLRTDLAGSMMMNVGNGGQTGPDGNFTIANVAPGEYVLQVVSRPRQAMAAGLDAESASVPVTINGQDLTGLTIVTSRGASVAGRVVFQSKSAPPTSRASLQVVASSTGPDMVQMGRAPGDGRVAENGSFELRGLSGPRLIRVTNVPSGWALKSVTLNGTDITDSPYEFKGEGTITGLEIVLTDRLTDLSGTVKDSRSQPLRDYVVVTFPDDSAQWDRSRFIRTGRPDQDGTFEIKGLPPGRYLAVALESLEQGAENDPDLLEQVRQSAKGFSLTDGQTLSIDLGLTVGP